MSRRCGPIFQLEKNKVWFSGPSGNTLAPKERPTGSIPDKLGEKNADTPSPAGYLGDDCLFSGQAASTTDPDPVVRCLTGRGSVRCRRSRYGSHAALRIIEPVRQSTSLRRRLGRRRMRGDKVIDRRLHAAL